MSEIIGGLRSGLRSVTANIDADTAAVEARQNQAKWMQEVARKIAAREFMYKLRGENQILKLDVSVASLRDKGAIELAKSA
ncbi:MAG: hypothetical protein LW817_00625 [Candidatus Caenarcaniphilales bacterium]|jgi:hypothetical protein|nr:hypothetical protein [Candidatus Caenarcaniphilales bacterium]